MNRIFICAKEFSKLLLNSINYYFQVLPKKNINLSKANKLQLALIAWRAFITKRAL